MSDGVMQVPDGGKVQDLVPLLINILEKVRRLPHGPTSASRRENRATAPESAPHRSKAG